MRDYNFKKAFTLAEVLITLGIIGIVAAMTMPSLIAKHQQDVILNQLKKSYSTFSNAIRLSEIDNGPMKDWPTGEQMDVNNYWNVYLNPYFNNAKLCKKSKDCGFVTDMSLSKWQDSNWGILTDNTRLLFQLYDGTVIFLPRNSQDNDGNPIYVNVMYIDVNGPKNPNEFCKDVFKFIRGTNNGIEPIGCVKSIMENGWKFPKDYQY